MLGTWVHVEANAFSLNRPYVLYRAESLSEAPIAKLITNCNIALVRGVSCLRGNPASVT